MTSRPIVWDRHLTGLEDTLLKRRSTRSYNGTDITLPRTGSGVRSTTLVAGAALLLGVAALALTRRRRETV